MEELEKVNSPKALEQFAARLRMQEEHMEEKFGKVRAIEQEMSNHFVNFALVNWVLTLHNLTHLKGMDFINAVNRVLMIHVTRLEANTKKMEAALGSEAMKRLGIDTETLYPTEVATRGLEEVQEAARNRAKAGKYFKLNPKKKIIV